MVEIGERLESDVEGMLLAIGVEMSAVTDSVEILDKFMKFINPIKAAKLCNSEMD